MPIENELSINNGFTTSNTSSWHRKMCACDVSFNKHNEDIPFSTHQNKSMNE